jgi:hypothetical protein
MVSSILRCSFNHVEARKKNFYITFRSILYWSLFFCVGIKGALDFLIFSIYSLNIVFLPVGVLLSLVLR